MRIARAALAATVLVMSAACGGDTRPVASILTVPEPTSFPLPPNHETPRFVTVDATPAVIDRGESSTLSWQMTGFGIVVFDGVSYIGFTGSVVVRPKTTTVYVLRTTGPTGGEVAEVRVRVRE